MKEGRYKDYISLAYRETFSDLPTLMSNADVDGVSINDGKAYFDTGYMLVSKIRGIEASPLGLTLFFKDLSVHNIEAPSCLYSSLVDSKGIFISWGETSLEEELKITIIFSTTNLSYAYHNLLSDTGIDLFITFSSDFKTVKVYKNNILQTPDTATEAVGDFIPSLVSPCLFADPVFFAFNLESSIELFEAYSRELSLEEIQNLSNNSWDINNLDIRKTPISYFPGNPDEVFTQSFFRNTDEDNLDLSGETRITVVSRDDVNYTITFSSLPPALETYDYVANPAAVYRDRSNYANILMVNYATSTITYNVIREVEKSFTVGSNVAFILLNQNTTWQNPIDTSTSRYTKPFDFSENTLYEYDTVTIAEESVFYPWMYKLMSVLKQPDNTYIGAVLIRDLNPASPVKYRYYLVSSSDLVSWSIYPTSTSSGRDPRAVNLYILGTDPLHAVEESDEYPGEILNSQRLFFEFVGTPELIVETDPNYSETETLYYICVARQGDYYFGSTEGESYPYTSQYSYGIAIIDNLFDIKRVGKVIDLQNMVLTPFYNRFHDIVYYNNSYHLLFHHSYEQSNELMKINYMKLKIDNTTDLLAFPPPNSTTDYDTIVVPGSRSSGGYTDTPTMYSGFVDSGFFFKLGSEIYAFLSGRSNAASSTPGIDDGNPMANNAGAGNAGTNYLGISKRNDYQDWTHNPFNPIISLPYIENEIKVFRDVYYNYNVGFIGEMFGVTNPEGKLVIFLNTGEFVTGYVPTGGFNSHNPMILKTELVLDSVIETVQDKPLLEISTNNSIIDAKYLDIDTTSRAYIKKLKDYVVYFPGDFPIQGIHFASDVLNGRYFTFVVIIKLLSYGYNNEGVIFDNGRNRLWINSTDKSINYTSNNSTVATTSDDSVDSMLNRWCMLSVVVDTNGITNFYIGTMHSPPTINGDADQLSGTLSTSENNMVVGNKVGGDYALHAYMYRGLFYKGNKTLGELTRYWTKYAKQIE